MIVVSDMGPLHLSAGMSPSKFPALSFLLPFPTRGTLIQRWGLTPGHTTDKLGFTWVLGRSFHFSKVALCATLGE